MADLAAALAEQGIRLKRLNPGHQEHVRCPKCQGGKTKELSLSVRLDDADGAVWNCKRGSCGWVGNVPGVDHRRDPRDQPPPRRIAKPEPHAQQLRPAALLDWFKGRGISAATVEAFGVYAAAHQFPIGGEWVKSHCVVFPYFFRAELVNRKYRHPAKHFVQDKDAMRSVWNIDAVAGNDTALWCEGEMDVMALAEAGFWNGLTLPDGAPAKLKAEDDPERDHDKRFEALNTCAEQIERLTKHVIATDMDEPGNVLAEELARRLGKERCWRVKWPDGCKDANDCLLKHGAEGVRQAIDDAKQWPIEGLFQVGPEELLQLQARGTWPTKPMPWTGFNGALRLPEEGRLFVVTGYPQSGKSEWVDALLVELLRSGAAKHVLLCSPENSPHELHASKLVEKWAGLPFLGAGGMRPHEVVTAGRWLAEHVGFLVQDRDAEALTLDWIIDRARRAILRHGSTWLVIDPWNEIEHGRARDTTETEYIGQALAKLKRFGVNHGCNVVVVAHPAKPPVDPRNPGNIVVPSGYSISSSAHWANKADIGLTVHRPSLKADMTEIHIWKVRFKWHGRRGAVVRLLWDRLTGRYTDDGEGPAAAADRQAGELGLGLDDSEEWGTHGNA